MPQKTFKPARQQKELGGPQIIEFFVHGGIGIRLSDASEGNWAGFGGRDDRFLFGDDRLQIMIRLHVRLPAIIRTSPGWLTFPVSLLGVCHGSQRQRLPKPPPSAPVLTRILDFDHRLHCEASADHESEVSTRSGEDCWKVRRGALTFHRM